MDECAELHVLVGGLGELEHVCRLEAGGVGAARGIGHEPVETGGGHLHPCDVGPHDLERLGALDAVALAPRDGGLLGHGEGSLRGTRLGERLLHGKAGSARELGHQLACPLIADELVLGTGERHEEQATHVVFVLLVREEHVARQVGGGAPADAPAPVVGVGDVDARELVTLGTMGGGEGDGTRARERDLHPDLDAQVPGLVEAGDDVGEAEPSGRVFRDARRGRLPFGELHERAKSVAQLREGERVLVAAGSVVVEGGRGRLVDDLAHGGRRGSHGELAQTRGEGFDPGVRVFPQGLEPA